MKQYPTISSQILRDHKVYVFDKLDGSNIRAQWNRKPGFWKFGSRHVLIDRSHPFLGEAVDLIKAWDDVLGPIFRRAHWDSVICFFEFYGEHSFAGLHESEPHRVSLFDVNVHKQGIIRPNEFIRLFGNFDVPRYLYYGNITVPFIESVKASQLDGMTFEGVVCKGVPAKPSHPPLMFKIKSEAWIKKLREHCAGNEAKFRELL